MTMVGHFLLRFVYLVVLYGFYHGSKHLQTTVGESFWIFSKHLKQIQAWRVVPVAPVFFGGVEGYLDGGFSFD